MPSAMPGFAFDGKVPKYMKLSCVLKPKAQQARRAARMQEVIPRQVWLMTGKTSCRFWHCGQYHQNRVMNAVSVSGSGLRRPDGPLAD